MKYDYLSKGLRLPRRFAPRNDVYGPRNDVYGPRNDVYAPRNDV